jgi:hypothetical protein
MDLLDPNAVPSMLRLISAVTLFVALAGTSAATTAKAGPYDAPFSALYRVEADGFEVGELKRSLSRVKDGVYLLQSKMYTTGLAALFKPDTIVERSTWMLEEGGVKPLRYEYKYEGRGGKKVEELLFDWSEGTITSVRDKERSTLDILPGILEKQVYQLRLQADLAAGKKEISYEVADRGDIRTYRFRVLGEETLDTDIGKLRTVKVERLSHSKERKTYIWCAIEHDYQLVQLVQEDDGHTFSSHIEKLDT